jgi:rhodanese-related sulfurtransferase
MSLDEHLERVRAGLARISPREAYEAMQRGAYLVDTRPEFQRRRDGEIPGAIIVERNQLEWRLDPTSDAHIPEAVGEDVGWILVCDEGYASSLAAASLREIGLRCATDVIGGFQAWRAASLPVNAAGTVTPPRLARSTLPHCK